MWLGLMTETEFAVAMRAAFDAGVSWARQNPSAFDSMPVVRAQKEAAAAECTSTFWALIPAPTKWKLVVEEKSGPEGPASESDLSR